MVLLADEIPFSGRNATNFEAYMYATTEKNIKRHMDFSDMECLTIYNGKTKQISGEDLKNRKMMLSFFNKCIKEFNNIDIFKDSRKLHMALWYIGVPDEENNTSDWQTDYLELKEAIIQFSKSNNYVIGVTTHFHQLDPDMSNVSYPHIHILYAPKKSKSTEINDFISKDN